MIQSTGVTRDGRTTEMTLVDGTGQRVRRGDVVTSFRGETAVLKGGKAPHKSSSSGRVYVDEGRQYTGEYFPSVYGLRWVEETPIR